MNRMVYGGAIGSLAAPPRRGSRAKALQGAGFASLLAAGGALWSAWPSAPTPPVAAPAAASLAPALRTDVAPLFAVAGGAGETVSRIGPGEAERLDRFTQGDPDAPGVWLRVAARLGGSRAPDSLFVALAREAADFGAAVERLAAAEDFTTALGGGVWAPASLAATVGRRDCVAFVVAANPAVQLSGFACPAAAAPRLERADLECLIERIAITAAGAELGLGPATARPPPRRAACRALGG